jgi:DNA-binding winged helix-turn-helix (wHTH) protein
LVTKDALLEAVWPETAVSDGALANCLMELRKILGEMAREPRFIATVHRQGYRFLAPVTQIDPPLADAATPPAPKPPVPTEFLDPDSTELRGGAYPRWSIAP